MKTSEITEGNKLIAEFMGGSYTIASMTIVDNIINLPFHGLVNMNELEYYSSWDWLMPVVDRVSEESAKKQKDDCVQLWMFLTNDIVSVWTKIIEFIQWYNLKLTK